MRVVGPLAMRTVSIRNVVAAVVGYNFYDESSPRTA